MLLLRTLLGLVVVTRLCDQVHMFTELPCSIEEGPIEFLNGFELLLGIENSSMYVGSIPSTKVFDNVIFFTAVVVVVVTVLESGNLKFGYQ